MICINMIDNIYVFVVVLDFWLVFDFFFVIVFDICRYFLFWVLYFGIYLIMFDVVRWNMCEFGKG